MEEECKEENTKDIGERGRS